jgi:nucleoside-diphosphate-sugar epimerase
MQKRRALITGATGFVGAHLAERLRREAWQVDVLVRPDSDRARLRHLGRSIRFHVHDGTTEQLNAIVRSARPSVVFHLAALYRSEHGPADIEPLIRSNLLFPTQLAEAMSSNSVRCLVSAGTSWQHYHDKTYSPVNLYAAMKQAADDILAFYREARGLKSISLKLFDTYGPGDPRKKLFFLFSEARKRPIDMSPGRQKVDLVHIDDVAEAFLVAAKRLLSGKVKKSEGYAVSSGRPMSLRAIASRYQEVTGARLLIRWGRRPYRHREVFTPWSTGRRLPGWRPRVGLEEGIARSKDI